MEEASRVALITGFGGVMLGGVITFCTESLFRWRDQRQAMKKNFVICICEIGRIYSELTTVYRSMTQELPEAIQPPMLSTYIRSFAAISIQPSQLDVATMFSANHSKDELFSELELSVRRFNSTLETLRAINEVKTRLQAQLLAADQLATTGEMDIAELRIDPTDAVTVTIIVQAENLYRTFLSNLVRDVEDCKSMLDRLNANSKRKFNWLPWLKPPHVAISEEVSVIAYLRDLPFFQASDLPVERVN